ncbi:DUF969 domain-containing protein [Vagococcus sp. PNs007]|uniref:DUF969 domain-containing protein n=1 Tax=Vagococcus proximus TaxID=2991417 RepID=A0ABT5X321_9ENTE|nr:DUF969 domain-containing protein [Vagococcus proximus]
MIKLIGIAIILIGFLLKFDTIAVVLIAGLSTALVSGISLVEFLELLGKAFVDNRLVTMFLLTLPMIGLSERFGLRQRAVYLISKIEGLTPGKFLTLYTFIREVACALSIRIQGHTQFIRPLVQPMAEAAAETKYGPLDAKDKDTIKALSAATDNYGNFFAQNTFVASSGVLLIVGTMESLGYKMTGVDIALRAIPVALFALIFVAIIHTFFDRYLQKKYGTLKDRGNK